MEKLSIYPLLHYVIQLQRRALRMKMIGFYLLPHVIV